MRTLADRPRIATIVEVAREAGVSKSAASRALLGRGDVSAETVRKVQEAAQKLGYVPNAMARGLVEQRTRILGVHLRDASNVFYAAMLGAMQVRANALGYRLISTSGTWKLLVEEEVQALQTLVSLRVDGIVVCSSALPSEHIAPFAASIPTVLTGRPDKNPSLTSVYLDEDHGGRTMARHVTELGHRHVAVLLCPLEQSISQHARGTAMVTALRADGADVEVVEMQERDEVPDSLGTAVASGITAILCPSNPLAVATIDWLRRRDLRVPDDVTVTGYDTTGPLGSEHIGLTSFEAPVGRLGREAIDLIVQLGNGTQQSLGNFRRRGRLVRGRSDGPPAQR